MKNKHLYSLGVSFALLTFWSVNTLATSWAYSFVVWDGYVYVISEEYVTEIEGEIGKVTKYSDMESLSGNFSNAYPKGTKYYSIKGVSTDEAIAVEESDGRYIKADRHREYAVRGAFDGFFDGQQGTIKIIGLWAIGILAVFFIFKVRRNK